ncbi:hypothetical protein OE810_06310 [Rhodobacteraceae bacterium XHP0102]|nr:hypothetical protein [Rhodobacteraceae bacterium XHP0102]
MTQKPAKPARKFRVTGQRGILFLLSLAFVASAFFRLGHIDMAWAVSTASEPSAPSGADAQICLSPEPLRNALARVEGRAEVLDAREAALVTREGELRDAQIMIEEQLTLLEETERRIEALMDISDGAAEGDLSQLTRLYETMDPAAAAALFGEMDIGFAAGFIARMRAEQSAAIMAELPSNTAYAISVFLATRNIAAPTRAEATEN